MILFSALLRVFAFSKHSFFSLIFLAPTVFFASIALLATISQSAFAATNCHSFGQSSVSYARHNLEAGCGFTGGAWADDYAGHRKWCEQDSVSDAQIAQILSDRKNMLLQCMAAKKPATPSIQACQNFANSAVAKARESVRLGCGYSSGAYADDYNGHYNWCLQQPIADVVAANQTTNNGIDQCRHEKLSGVCGFYVAAISPLYRQQNEACAGRADFQIVASNPDHDRQQCLQNAAPDAAWVNAQVSAMNARIEMCRSNTITYSNLGYRGALLDACTNDLGAFCQDWVPKGFCEWKGHKRATQVSRTTTDFTVHLDCLKTGNVSATAEKKQCYCSGTCGGISQITCTGRR